MTLYAVGDIQGCATPLERLLEAIEFAPGADRLWLVGDLVNRGPDSLRVLRTVVGLGDCVTAVLGNHDLHLLATAAGVRPLGRDDTFQAVLEAPDRADLIDWLRTRPLIHHDAAAARVLVHAGVPSLWSLEQALAEARAVEQRLAGADWQDSLRHMYGNEPGLWRDALDRDDRHRYTINALTRMRFCDHSGRLDFEHSGPPGSQPAHLVPWFDVPGRPTRTVHIVFGHWAALGLLRRADITALDSGCVWGGALTAVPLEPSGEPVVVPCV